MHREPLVAVQMYCVRCVQHTSEPSFALHHHHRIGNEVATQLVLGVHCLKDLTNIIENILPDYFQYFSIEFQPLYRHRLAPVSVHRLQWYSCLLVHDVELAVTEQIFIWNRDPLLN